MLPSRPFNKPILSQRFVISSLCSRSCFKPMLPTSLLSVKNPMMSFFILSFLFYFFSVVYKYAVFFEKLYFFTQFVFSLSVFLSFSRFFPCFHIHSQPILLV